MGVSGLWDVLRPAACTHSLSQLAVTRGFEGNLNGQRGFRIGIDVSIWFFHTRVFGGKTSRTAMGENPELRLLFFKCAQFLPLPLLPLFVFDGSEGPESKRGRPVSRNRPLRLVNDMKELIRAFGYEYRDAPGEADAQLAYLNRIGVIDAVMSDDVDVFLFGGTTIIRNPSPTLSGNRANPVTNLEGKQDRKHVHVYTATDLQTHRNIRLTRGGLILVALMSGGDYLPAGIPGIGVTTARGLAECGFGDRLVEAVRTLQGDALNIYLDRWRADIIQELRTDSRNIIKRKNPRLAKTFPADFPPLEVVNAYVSPVISSKLEDLEIDWWREPDPALLARLCEQHFEWGPLERILGRFENLVWPGIVCRTLRRSVFLLDIAATPPLSQGAFGVPTATARAEVASGKAANTVAPYSSHRDSNPPVCQHLDAPSAEPFILKVLRERACVSTDYLREFRLEIAPLQLAKLARQGVRGTHNGQLKDHVLPDTTVGVWVPACMVELAEPSLARDYKVAQERKLREQHEQLTRHKQCRQRRQRKQHKRGDDVNGQHQCDAIGDATSATANHLSACQADPGSYSMAQFFSDDDLPPAATPRKPRTKANSKPSRVTSNKKRPRSSPSSSDNETEEHINMRSSSHASSYYALPKSSRKSKLQASPPAHAYGDRLRNPRIADVDCDYTVPAAPKSLSLVEEPRKQLLASQATARAFPSDPEVIVISSSEDECPGHEVIDLT